MLAGRTPPRVVVVVEEEVMLLRSVEEAIEAMEAMEGVSDLWRLRVRGRGGLGVAGRLEEEGGFAGWVGFEVVLLSVVDLRGGLGRLVVRWLGLGASARLSRLAARPSSATGLQLKAKEGASESGDGNGWSFGLHGLYEGASSGDAAQDAVTAAP
jgi:hypothetical protein